MAVVSIAQLVQEVTPYIGQDCQLIYRVRTSTSLLTDETITGWTLLWTLATSVSAASASLLKTTASGITIATPYATVSLTAANMNTLTAGQEYRMQLWRNDAGNVYPLTGLGLFIPQAAPPLA